MDQASLNPAEPDGDQLFRLLGDLRAAGFEIGVEETIVTQQVAEGWRTLDDKERPGELAGWLGPVLCSSPEQQREFRRLYDAWWARESRGVPTSGPAGGGVAKLIEESRPGRWIAGGVAAVVLIFLVWLIIKPTTIDETPSGGEPSPAATASPPPPTTTPALVGLTVEEALAVLGQAGLRPEWVPAGTPDPSAVVVQQSPAPGAALTGSTVRLVLGAARPEAKFLSVTVTARDAQGTPVSGATLQVANASSMGVGLWEPPTATTDATGQATVTASPSRRVVVSLTHPSHHPPSPLAGSYEAGTLAVNAELHRSGTAFTRWLDRYAGGLRWVGAAIIWVGGFFWFSWAGYRRKLIVERRETRDVHDLSHLGLPEPPNRLYRGAAFARSRIEARRPQPGGDADLDVAGTVDRTIRRLGLFSPAFRPRVRMPAYLALVDRLSLSDQQTRLAEEFLRRLSDEGVAVDAYAFSRDPRRVTRMLIDPRRPGSRRVGHHYTLRELAAAHPDQRLLLFGDGHGLTDPVTGQMASWTSSLAVWGERAVLSPVAPCHWSSAEVELAASGLRVVPFTPRGLTEFVGQQHGNDLPPTLLAWRPPFPPLLIDQPGLWLERAEPPAEDVEELLWQLKAYLGPDGFAWLSAIAMYPVVNWFITLHVGLGLTKESGERLLDEQGLLDLVALPWFRHGFMPDWLRLRLARELPGPREEAARALFRGLMAGQLEARGGPHTLPIATKPRSTSGRRWRRFFADAIRTEPEDSPLLDYLFVDFLLGSSPGKLQLEAPPSLRRFLYHRGWRSLGARPMAGILTCALLTVAVIFGMPPLVAKAITSSTGTGESRLEQAAFTPASDPPITVPSPQPVASPIAPGYLRIDTDVARVTVDGVTWDRRNPVELTPGRHAVVFFNQGASLRRNADVRSGLTSSMQVRAAELRPQPFIAALQPSVGIAGTTVTVTVEGKNLQEVRSFTFGPGIAVSPVRMAGDRLVVTLQIADDAEPGSRQVQVIDSVGRSTGLRLSFLVRPSPAQSVQADDEITVPDVRGYDRGLAVKNLEGLGLQPVIISSSNLNAEQSLGCVGAQEPSPGTRVARGTRVSLQLRPCATAK